MLLLGLNQLLWW